MRKSLSPRLCSFRCFRVVCSGFLKCFFHVFWSLFSKNLSSCGSRSSHFWASYSTLKRAYNNTIHNNNMQFTATKLFTAFLALIALMQFVSGAALYSEMKDDAKITVSVSDVALTDGCAPTVGGLFSLVFVFCWFRKFSSFTSSVWRRKHHERIENRRELTFNREICSLLCRFLLRTRRQSERLWLS